MKNRFKTLFLLFLLASSLQVFSQPQEQNVKVVIAPDHNDWIYKTGEKARFNVTVMQYGNPLKNVPLRYELGPEKMEAQKKDSLVLSSGSLSLDGGTLKTPGFLRLMAVAYVNGKPYRGLATAAFEPEKILPTVSHPQDFTRFWENAKADLARVPLDTRMTLLPERSTERVSVYHVNLQNIGNSRLYGILSVPKAPGKYPALLRVPGAGVRPYFGDIATADKGIITFEIGIHGVPVTMDPVVYQNLGQGALSGYWAYNMDNRDRFYYKRVYLGCVRANDFLVSLPQYDGTHLGVMGGSQGGALSMVTAALDPRVKFLAAFYPALSDVTGYLHERAGGWPHYFDKNNTVVHNKKDKIETISYFDVVNFAKALKVPGLYSWGFNDEVCPPTSMYAAYNVITAPKELFLAQETGHWTYPEQNEKLNNWITGKLQSK